LLLFIAAVDSSCAAALVVVVVVAVLVGDDDEKVRKLTSWYEAQNSRSSTVLTPFSRNCTPLFILVKEQSFDHWKLIFC
jgi:hypothetical protein